MQVINMEGIKRPFWTLVKERLRCNVGNNKRHPSLTRPPKISLSIGATHAPTKKEPIH